MTYPAGILTNTVTGRAHPILFRPAPMPGGADDGYRAHRYKSMGHHTEGFATMAEAEAWLKACGDCVDMGGRGDWNGEGVPAMIDWFSPTEIDTAKSTPTLSAAIAAGA